MIMQQEAIFIPFFGMQLLTLVVWLTLFFRRIPYMSRQRIPPQSAITPEKLNQQLPDHIASPANNLKNLFELPVLFYGLCLYLYTGNHVDQGYLIAAYSFLFLRGVHSFIHCTYNRVMHRFTIYVLSSIVLWFMLIKASVALVNSL